MRRTRPPVKRGRPQPHGYNQPDEGISSIRSCRVTALALCGHVRARMAPLPFAAGPQVGFYVFLAAGGAATHYAGGHAEETIRPDFGRAAVRASRTQPMRGAGAASAEPFAPRKGRKRGA